MNKKNIAVIFGGNSSEYKVSLSSATSVINNINKDKYNVILIGITKDGKWLRYCGDTEKIQRCLFMSRLCIGRRPHRNSNEAGRNRYRSRNQPSLLCHILRFSYRRRGTRGSSLRIACYRDVGGEYRRGFRRSLPGDRNPAGMGTGPMGITTNQSAERLFKEKR